MSGKPEPSPPGDPSRPRSDREPPAIPEDLEQVEWEADSHPGGEPFATLLGEPGPTPEVDYRPSVPDPTGASGLWRALEGFETRRPGSRRSPSPHTAADAPRRGTR